MQFSLLNKTSERRRQQWLVIWGQVSESFSHTLRFHFAPSGLHPGFFQCQGNDSH